MKRGRRTTILVALARERLKGCEECWPDNAVWTVEEALSPLHVRVRERRRLMRALSCPNCEEPIVDFNYGRVVGYEEDELCDIRRVRRAATRYKTALDEFHRFLLAYPTLGGIHPTGRQLERAVSAAPVFALAPKRWFRARRHDGTDLVSADFQPPDPTIVSLSAGRFNGAGQFGYYLAEARDTAAIEVLGARILGESIWITPVDLTAPLQVLNLTIQTIGDITGLPQLLTSLVYLGALSDYGEDSSLPQYRVPQFLADLARKRQLDGILYTRRRDSGFPNPDAWGTNLVALRSTTRLALSVGQPIRYHWVRLPFDFPTTVGGIVLTPA